MVGNAEEEEETSTSTSPHNSIGGRSLQGKQTCFTLTPCVALRRQRNAKPLVLFGGSGRGKGVGLGLESKIFVGTNPIVWVSCRCQVAGPSGVERQRVIQQVVDMLGPSAVAMSSVPRQLWACRLSPCR